MPFLCQNLCLFQQSYEGFRNFRLDDHKHLYFQRVDDWVDAGHPFKPVQQEFLTYYLSAKKQNYAAGINITKYKKKKGYNLETYAHTSAFSDILPLFEISRAIAGQCNASTTAFTYATNRKELDRFKIISGSSSYKGREGIEFYPQELLLLKPLRRHGSTFLLQNYQNKRSKYKVAADTISLEKQFLHPLIKA